MVNMESFFKFAEKHCSFCKSGLFKFICEISVLLFTLGITLIPVWLLVRLFESFYGLS